MSEPGDAVQADDAPVIDTWPLFVTCGRGLESILVDELIRFGATDVKAGNGGVSARAHHGRPSHVVPACRRAAPAPSVRDAQTRQSSRSSTTRRARAIRSA